MSNYRLDHNIPRGPEKINGYNTGRSPFDYPDGICGPGEEYVAPYRKDNGEYVSGYCRKKREDLSGQYEGKGSTPQDAIDSILRSMNLPSNGGGDVEYFNENGETLGPDDEVVSKRGKADFNTTVYKDGKYYSLGGVVHKKGRKWIAGGESSEVEFD